MSRLPKDERDLRKGKDKERNEGRTRIGLFALRLRVMQFFLDFEFLEDRQYLAFYSFNSQDK